MQEQQQFNIKEATNDQLQGLILTIKANMADAFLAIEQCKTTQAECTEQINQMQVSISRVNQEIELRKQPKPEVLSEDTEKKK